MHSEILDTNSFSFKLAIICAVLAETAGLADKQIPLIVMQCFQCFAWFTAGMAAIYSIYTTNKKNKKGSKNKYHSSN